MAQPMTVAQKIAECNRERSNPKRVLTHEEQERAKEVEIQNYWDLARMETLPTNQAFSLRRQVERKKELLDYRKKFWNDERALTLDPSRPESLVASEKYVAELLDLLKKHGDDYRWDRAPRVDGSPITLEDFVSLLTAKKA